MTNRCETCKFWGKDVNDPAWERRINKQVAMCGKIGETADGCVQGTLAVIFVELDCHSAELFTTADFGCLMHEAK